MGKQEEEEEEMGIRRWDVEIEGGRWLRSKVLSQTRASFLVDNGIAVYCILYVMLEWDGTASIMVRTRAATTGGRMVQYCGSALII